MEGDIVEEAEDILSHVIEAKFFGRGMTEYSKEESCAPRRELEMIDKHDHDGGEEIEILDAWWNSGRE